MPRDYAYASYGDIQAHLSFIPTFTATSQPNATQAHLHLVDASNQLDSVLAIADYGTPVATTATHALELLRSWTSIGAAWKVAMSMPQGKDSKHADALGKEWQTLLGQVINLRGQQAQLDKGRETTHRRHTARTAGEEAAAKGQIREHAKVQRLRQTAKQDPALSLLPEAGGQRRGGSATKGKKGGLR